MTPALAPTASDRKARGILLMLCAVLCFTAMDALVKLLIAGYPAAQLLWVRFALQFAIVLAILSVRGTLRATLRTRFGRLHLLRAALQFLTGIFFFSSLAYIGLVEAQALADLSPVLITLGAALFLGERLDRSRLIGVVVALTGALVILRPGLAVFSPSALLPIAAACSYAGFALITRRVGSQESPWTSMVYASAFGTLAGGAIALPGWQPLATDDLPLLLAVGLLGTGAQLFVVRSFSIAEASVVAPFTYAGLLCAAVWGLILFGEVPDIWTVLGALVIAGAGLYVWHRETRAASRAE
jgi:drug/metabolite transporter (DMT)-like permease